MICTKCGKEIFSDPSYVVKRGEFHRWCVPTDAEEIARLKAEVESLRESLTESIRSMVLIGWGECDRNDAIEKALAALKETKP